MISRTIRQEFLSFFHQKGHQIIPSASLVPHNDPSLLFTAAGMVPFKDYFLGAAQPPHKMLTSSQKCVRAGGKHNDLDNVGYTKRHHTFFEMLGNFSFSQYFKEEAIALAWGFLTKTLQLDTSKLSVTYYHSDHETAELWKKFLPENRITPIKTDDNFWSMGATGPCGPCTEIFYDFSDLLGTTNVPDDERFVEIWNLVFMQFNTLQDGSQVPLAAPCVDTGMGLERLACILQNVNDNYETDILSSLKQHLCSLLEVNASDTTRTSLNVIADHIRCATFLIADGVLPDNVGRGYVLRKILRRAMRYAHKLSCTDPILYKASSHVLTLMGEDFNDLNDHAKLIQETIKREEEKFCHILDRGLRVFHEERENTAQKQFSPKVVFDLYDTYGFPFDLTYELLRNHHMDVNKNEVENLLLKQKETSQAHWKTTDSSSDKKVLSSLAESIPPTTFTGFSSLEDQGSIQLIIQDAQSVETLSSNSQGWLILEQTPFYAEGGGQVGDIGSIKTPEGTFSVLDTQKLPGNRFAHWGAVSEGQISKKHKAVMTVDPLFRKNTQAHHTATHLLHKALHERFSTSVVQKGSYVCSDYLRFDVHLPQTITQEDIGFLEEWVNHRIAENLPVITQEKPLQEARSLGAIGLFGEKYGDIVRIVSIGDDVSREFCGGCHVQSTAQIGVFHILSHQSIGSDTKRLTACIGHNVLKKTHEYKDTLQQACSILNVSSAHFITRLEALVAKSKSKEKSKVSGSKTVKVIDDITVTHFSFENSPLGALRKQTDAVRNLTNHMICVSNVAEGKVSLMLSLSPNLIERFSASDMIRAMSLTISEKANGGGRKDFAQCGGTQPSHIEKALLTLEDMISGKA